MAEHGHGRDDGHGGHGGRDDPHYRPGRPPRGPLRVPLAHKKPTKPKDPRVLRWKDFVKDDKGPCPEPTDHPGGWGNPIPPFTLMFCLLVPALALILLRGC